MKYLSSFDQNILQNNYTITVSKMAAEYLKKLNELGEEITELQKRHALLLKKAKESNSFSSMELGELDLLVADTTKLKFKQCHEYFFKK